jgi:hypothetical protein
MGCVRILFKGDQKQYSRNFAEYIYRRKTRTEICWCLEGRKFSTASEKLDAEDVTVFDYEKVRVARLVKLWVGQTSSLNVW